MIRKIIYTSLLIPIIAFSQFRAGLDISRQITLSGIGSDESESADALALTLGYEKMLLLGFVGVGGEYTLDLEEEGINMAYLYGVGKIPIFPFMRGIIRAGYSIPMGDAGDMYDPALAYGVGARFKLPIIPIGLEALYTIHSLEMKSTGEDWADALIDALDFKLNALNITATLKF